MAKLYNLARMTTATVGAGTITLGSAANLNGVLYLTFAQAGVLDGDTVTYAIEDPAGASEIGTGVYTASVSTLTRTVINSTNGNAAINLSGRAQVFISPSTAHFFDQGTACLFQQTAAPTGWTKQTTHNDKALRVVSGTASSGGSIAFSTVFAQSGTGTASVSGTTDATTPAGVTSGSTAIPGTTDPTTITTATMPSHAHAQETDTLRQNGGTTGALPGCSPNVGLGGTTQSNGSGGSHTHGLTGTGHTHTVPGSSHTHTFTSNPHSHTMDIRVLYVDLILATKD